MSLITQKSQIEADIAEKDAGILRAATALHYAATVIATENNRFWSIPTDRLLAVLNENVALTLSTFAANTQAATAINALLDAVAMPELSRRAPTEPARADITFDGTSFVLVPPVAPEEI
jgi:CRP-like cAMP-binding protein